MMFQIFVFQKKIIFEKRFFEKKVIYGFMPNFFWHFQKIRSNYTLKQNIRSHKAGEKHAR